MRFEIITTAFDFNPKDPSSIDDGGRCEDYGAEVWQLAKFFSRMESSARGNLLHTYAALSIAEPFGSQQVQFLSFRYAHLPGSLNFVRAKPG
jgi:hypothetical protein